MTTVVGSSKTPKQPEGAVNLDRIIGLNPPALRHVAVNLLDAPLSVLAVSAHVPLAYSTVGTRDRIRTSDDTHDKITFLQPTSRVRLRNAPERLVAQNKARFTGRSPAIFAFHNFNVGTTNSDRNRFHQYRALAHIWFRNFLQLGGPWLLRFDSDCLDVTILASGLNAVADFDIVKCASIAVFGSLIQ